MKTQHKSEFSLETLTLRISLNVYDVFVLGLIRNTFIWLVFAFIFISSGIGLVYIPFPKPGEDGSYWSLCLVLFSTVLLMILALLVRPLQNEDN